MSTGKKPERSTAKRRRPQATYLGVSKSVVVMTLASLVLLLPCRTRAGGGLFITAFHGQWIPRSNRQELLSARRIASKSGPCFSAPKRRVPFHKPCRGDHLRPWMTNPSLDLPTLSSTAMDTSESSDYPAVVGVAPTQNATTTSASNGVAENTTTASSPDVSSVNGWIQSNTNGATTFDDESNIPIWETNQQPLNDDVPHPTANGGYSHTKASKAKISAANKGRVPWNKGKTRSEATRARIAAGVRARNRQNFLKKLEEQGITEEEYEAKKQEERRKKEEDKQARRTEKGGYKPTEETKKKISKLLKAKWKSGEIKKRPVDPSKVRRGFTHSEETRKKISESLKKRWANDEKYRANMVEKSTVSNSAEDVRKRISETLKARWQEPEFRAKMMSKIATRKTPDNAYGKSHRERISEAMKLKWQDKEYRKKAVGAMAKSRADKGILPSTRKRNRKTTNNDVIRPAQPRAVKKLKKVKVKKKKTTKKTVVARKSESTAGKTTTKRRKRKPKGSKKEPDGSISRLREERRDLYDLLYADEDDDAISPTSRTAFAIGDEDLDDFDPYGLEDF